jgi:hypothetical protein
MLQQHLSNRITCHIRVSDLIKRMTTGEHIKGSNLPGGKKDVRKLLTRKTVAQE